MKSVNKKYEKILNLGLENLNHIQKLKSSEDKVKSVISEYEQAMRDLEIKFEEKIQLELKARSDEIKNNKDKYPNFWLNALSNHKLFKDFITIEDVEVLKHLEDISYRKEKEGSNFTLIFTFGKNDYFTNEVLEKTYKINDELLIEEIVSTEINWLKRNIAFQVKDKKMKNKSIFLI